MKSSEEQVPLQSLLFIIIVLAAYFRLFWGIDFSDESQYLSQILILKNGGTVFETDLLYQQTAGLLIYPFVWLYTSLFKTEAFALFVRHLHLLWGLLGLYYFYKLLRSLYSSKNVLLASSLLIAFTPFSIPSWSYNNFAYFGIPMFLGIYYSTTVRSLRSVDWSALVAGAAIFCYPTLIVPIGFFILWELLSKSHKIGRFVFWLSIAGSLQVLFFSWIGLVKIHRVLEFSKLFGELGGLEKIQGLTEGLLAGPLRSFVVWLLIPLLLALFHRRKSEPSGFRLPLGLLLVLLLSWFSAESGNILIQYSLIIYCSVYLLVLLGLFFAASRETVLKLNPARRSFVILLITGIVYAYTSGNGLLNFSVAAPPLIAFLVLELEQLNKTKNTFPVLNLATLFFAICLLVLNYQYIYREDSLEKLTTQVMTGPFRFIRTTPDKALLTETAHHQIQALNETNQTIFCSYYAPCYLSAKLLPITGMLSVHEINWEQRAEDLILYQSKELNRWPDIIFTKKVTTPNFTYQFENFFLKTGRYKSTYESDLFRILKRE